MFRVMLRFLRLAAAGHLSLGVIGFLQAQPPQNIPGSNRYAVRYTRWNRVTPNAVLMNAEIAFRCSGLTPEEQAEGRTNPHFFRYLTVYINDKGRPAMMKQKKPQFPVGTVIVKQKVLFQDGQPQEKEDALAPRIAPKIELLTVMTKMRRGYDRQHGDWEYKTVDGASHIITAQGKLKPCQSCHDKQSASDHVFRNYLPATVQASLR